MRLALVLPSVYVAISLILFGIGYFCVHSTAFWNQSMNAANYEAEPPLLPFLLPAVLTAFIRGPGVIFSTFDIGGSREIVLLPCGVFWWWWLGAQFDARKKPRPKQWVRGMLYVVVSVLTVAAAVMIIPSVAQRYWRYSHFGLSTWRGAMWTADVMWLVALAVILAERALAWLRGNSGTSAPFSN